MTAFVVCDLVAFLSCGVLLLSPMRSGSRRPADAIGAAPVSGGRPRAHNGSGWESGGRPRTHDSGWQSGGSGWESWRGSWASDTKGKRSYGRDDWSASASSWSVDWSARSSSLSTGRNDAWSEQAEQASKAQSTCSFTPNPDRTRSRGVGAESRRLERRHMQNALKSELNARNETLVEWGQHFKDHAHLELACGEHYQSERAAYDAMRSASAHCQSLKKSNR